MHPRQPRRLDFKRNAAIRGHVTVSGDTGPKIRRDVPTEEAGRAKGKELTDVDQLVGDERLAPRPFAANDDEATQRDRMRLRWHRPADEQAVAITFLDTHYSSPAGVRLGRTLPAGQNRRMDSCLR